MALEELLKGSPELLGQLGLPALSSYLCIPSLPPHEVLNCHHGCPSDLLPEACLGV